MGNGDDWWPIETALKNGKSILTVGLDSKTVTETRWLDPGPYVRTLHECYYKPAGWYWAGWDGAVGPITPTQWMPMPDGPINN